jgi:hypothetical protein
MKGAKLRYTDRQLAFIKRRRKMARRDLHVSFVRKFRRRDVSMENLKQLCTRRGWLTGPRKGRFKGRLRVYTKAELTWIKRRRTMPRRELHAAFIIVFPNHAISLKGFKQLCKAKGFMTGRDGRLVKGNIPANKGKKMPFNANSARTRFKKGNRTGRANQVYKPIGSTRLSKDGYLERKVHDGLPMQSRWRAVHLLNWEKKHGALPASHCLKCLDGDRLNTDPSNWELISRAVLARLNKSRNRFDTAPAELKPAIMAIAKLRDRLCERSRNQQSAAQE